jgi:hypothetical protein
MKVMFALYVEKFKKKKFLSYVGGHIFQQRTSNDGKRSHGHLS